MSPSTYETITIVTPTVGNSANRLRILCDELRDFTDLPFKQIVVDDGTINEQAKDAQFRATGLRHSDCLYFENPGPMWGCSYNLNYAFEHVETPWAFLIEDGLRPGLGWLETAADFIDKIGSRAWQGHKVGMAGCASLQDWNLALGGVWPGVDVMEVFHGKCDQFYAGIGGHHDTPSWNDGLWCWKRLLPGMMEACRSEKSNLWQSDVMQFKQIALDGIFSLMVAGMHPCDLEQAWQKWRTSDHWPARRTAWCGWYPGAFMLVNMEAWRAVGRFRDGCTFFEGHLGTRMGMAGYLSLCVEFPPFLHCPSQGFKAAPSEGRTPRIHLDTEKVFREDFKGLNNLDAPNVLANAVVSLDKQRAIGEELAKVQLWRHPAWAKWE